ncbi:Clavaminate synthase-like protein [Thozetella sp. PMI_491]|nr:Clavaminate synthase-like protein [Thozetella sp. PMI_491]
MSTPTVFEVPATALVRDAGCAPLSQSDVAATLPAGFPAKLDAKLAWSGSDFKDESDYVVRLVDSDIAEIDVAVAHFKGFGLDGDLVTPENFPLPTVGPKLEALSREVHHGKGFGLLRGINPVSYTVEDLTLVSLGLQCYIADHFGRQDKRGNMLVHIVADDSNKDAVEHHRHSNKSITFHNEEAGDVVAWLTRSTAASGGKCVISSAYTIYNVLAATHPEMIRTLARADWPFAFPKFHCRPIIFYEDSKLIMNFGRAPLIGNVAHPRSARLPTLTQRQVEALDAIEAIARATEMHIRTQAGDLHFINNLAVLHRREGFVDGQATTEKRHLVRSRLRSSKHGWSIPEGLKPDWSDAFEKPGSRQWHIEPMPPFFFPLRKCPN